MSYFDEARARAKRRKSPWNLLLIPAVVGPWLFLSWFSAVGLGKLHRVIYPGHEFVILPETVGGILMAVAPLLAWLAPSMIIGNLLVAAISPAKRVLDAEAASVPDTDLASANRVLRRYAIFMLPVGLGLGLIGAWIP